MATDTNALTEKEKQTLRLIVRGHDAKSSARHLGLSVHTINERLRDARRKLEVSSSREAARQLFEAEGGDPQSLTDKRIGEATAAPLGEMADLEPARTRRPAYVVEGVIIMSIIVAFAALAALNAHTPSATGPSSPATAAAVEVAAVETEAVSAARAWLVLGDQGRWKDGWLATADSFRKVNTAERWAEAATKVRVPMGALVSRTALSEVSAPTPPNGAEIVRFRSSFANRADVTETVSLVREGGTLKVNGIYVE